MKSVITAICLLIPLVILFVIIDRKDFYSGDDIFVKQEAVTGKKPTTGATLKPVEKPVETNLVDTTPVTETKPAETTPVAESKPAETKPVVETKPVKTKPTEMKPMPAPAAVPVVTAEEAEKLNVEALLFAEKNSKKLFFEKKGLKLVSRDEMSSYNQVSIPDRYDEIKIKNGIALERNKLSKKIVPNMWEIDFDSLKGNCDFDKKDNGFEIVSPDAVLRINAPSVRVFNTMTGLSFKLSGNTPETKVKVGIEEFGLYGSSKAYIGELSGSFKEDFINCEVSAFDHHENVLPFLEIEGDVTIHSLRVYQKELLGTTYLEGKIIDRSVLPDPKASDYPNCRYSVHFEGNVIKSGKPCPREIVLIIDGFEDYKSLKTDSLNKEDKIACSIIPYEMLPDEQQSIQLADDLNLFLLENYYVLGMRKLDAYTSEDNVDFPASGIHFLGEKKEYVSIFNRQINPPIPKALQDAQNDSIRRDIDEINKILSEYTKDRINAINTSFMKAWTAEKEKDPPGRNRLIVGNEPLIWRQVDNSFFTISPNQDALLPENPTGLKNNECLDALLSLKKALEANGVQLIVSVIPYRDSLVARIINKDFRNVIDYGMYYVIKSMLEHGIETVTPSKDVPLRYNEEEFTFNVGADWHPSVLIQKITSEILAKRLERYNIPKRLKKELFVFKEENSRFYGVNPMKTYPDNCDIGIHNPGEEIKVKKPMLLEGYNYTNDDSEVLVVGNSFTVSPYISEYGLVSWLDYNTETDVSYFQYASNGPATVFISNLLSNPEKFLRGKKVLILQLSPNLLFELATHWHNISLVDRQLCLLSSATLVSTLPVLYPDGVVIHSDWSDQQKACIGRLQGIPFTIQDNDYEIANVPSETNGNKSFIVIPTYLIAGNVSLTVNGESQIVPSSYDASINDIPSYQLLVFEISNETKRISVSASGEKGSKFVIKDIEIWQ